MITEPAILSRWPKWLRIVFTVFSFLFVFAIIQLIDIIFRESRLYIYNPNPWVIVFLELLILLIFLRLIFLSLRQGKNFRTISISILYGLLAVFLVMYIQSLNRQVAATIEQEKQLSQYLSMMDQVTSSQTVEIANLRKIISNIDPSLLPGTTIPSEIETPISEVSGEPSSSATDNLILYITAITGLITAITGLYGQILSARKMKFELELARKQSELAHKQSVKKPRSTQTTNKATTKRTKKK